MPHQTRLSGGSTSHSVKVGFFFKTDLASAELKRKRYQLISLYTVNQTCDKTNCGVTLYLCWHASAKSEISDSDALKQLQGLDVNSCRLFCTTLCQNEEFAD